MACVHEFGIVENIDPYKNYIDYEPHKYNCITIHDDYIETISEQLMAVNVYWHNLNRPHKGLAYTGITLIPPEALPFFQAVLSASEYKAVFQELLNLVAKAIETQKYMIHFGI